MLNQHGTTISFFRIERLLASYYRIDCYFFQADYRIIQKSLQQNVQLEKIINSTIRIPQIKQRKNKVRTRLILNIVQRTVQMGNGNMKYKTSDMNQCSNVLCFFRCDLTIINQSMTNTLDTYRPLLPSFARQISPKKLEKRNAQHMLIILVVLFSSLCISEAKQTVIVQSLASKNDKILAKLLEETHSYIEYQRYISSVTFQCKAILKNQLTKNTPEKITKISLHLDFAQVMSLQVKEVLLNYEPEQIELIRQIDKVLDILNGQCLYYTTNTFIYEYCHKEHVRQFDTAYTKSINAKPEFEDISMGVYNPEQYRNKRIKRGITELTAQQKKVTIPELSDFEKDYNFLFIDDVNQKEGTVQFQESEDGNYLFTNAQVILTEKYQKQLAYFLVLYCEQRQPDFTNRQVKNYAILIDPYTFVYTKKQGRCDKYVSHSLLPKLVTYQADDAVEPIRAYGKYLYGNVEQICTKKWAWQRKDNDGQFDTYLQQGSMLFLQLYNTRLKQEEYHYVTINKVISESLIQLDVPLGKSFKLTPEMDFVNRSTFGSSKLISNITKCELMFKKRLNLKKNIQMAYINNGIIKVSTHQTIKAGDNLGCICKSIVQENVKIIDLDVTIAAPLFLNYYQAKINSNTNIYSTQAYPGMEYLLRQCEQMTCFPFIQKDSIQKNQDSNKKRVTEIKKINKNEPHYHFNSSNADNLYVLSIKGNGIIKLMTRSKDGNVYNYLITEGQIIKMIEFANGTKQIIKENKFYQNLTMPQQEHHKNYIYIKISRLSNGSYYGGIWKTSDYVFFPRFTLFDEQLVSLQRKSGYAYLRILNLDNLKNKDHMAVLAYMKKLELHYSVKEKKKADPEASLFLNQTYSVNYTYVSGKYCDPPVNKFRKTTVNLKCGNPWFLITKLFEVSPCEYFLQIQTTLLCKQGHKEVQQLDENLFNRNGDDVVISNGILCHPVAGLFNEASPYLYLKKSIQ